MGEAIKFPTKLATKPQKATRTTVDTILVTPEVCKSWKNPPFQRPLKVNDKVRGLAEVIRQDGGVIPGVITLGVLEREKYLIDGQHRREAFLLSECTEGFVDVRLHHFESMAEMGAEFVALNSSLVRLKPDDILRGLEGSSDALSRIRKKCPFVGYDMIRRGERSPILSMSSVLRCWFASGVEVPSSSAGPPAAQAATVLSVDDADAVVDVLALLFSAWGRDDEHKRLWSSLNLAICMWLYRRCVVGQYTPATTKLTREQFGKCAMSLAADASYNDWLVGRQLSDRDRSPCYNRMKAVFARRVEQDTGKKPRLPGPAWAHSGGGKSY